CLWTFDFVVRTRKVRMPDAVKIAGVGCAKNRLRNFNPLMSMNSGITLEACPRYDSLFRERKFED
ncbi:MAG: hypothetical protein ACQESJ_09515, partial [Bacteroidota bacterium]